ncbi:MAG: MMPL family transporter [Nitriliruptoraceae bacterium]
MLDALARLATRVPSLTLLVLFIATVGFGALATQLEVDTGVEGFAPEGGIVETLDEVGDRFGTASAVQVLVDAGPGGDVLRHDVVLAVERLRATLEADPVVTAALREDRTGQPAIITFAFPFTAAVDDLDDLEPFELELIVDAVLDEAYDDIAPLLSSELDPSVGRARSGLVQVSFDAEVDDETRRAAAARVGDLVAEFSHPGLRTGVMSLVEIERAIEASLARDMPVLMGTSLLLVLLVLGLLFRSVADVVVGFVGLTASIVWMAGLGTLLGPRYLGMIGDFSQIGIAIPVLLVGLGVDYSVHLTTRYREQRALGDDARLSARVAMTTVGFALVLATVASVAGFLANLATPLPPIRDFGILAAAGIVAAFIVLGGLVPATRTLIDQRLDRRGHTDDRSPAARRVEGHTPRWVRAAITVATRHPWPALGTTAVLLGAGIVAATGLSTEFDERDFLPTNEPVIATIDRLEQQFGGDVGERTYVLVDGDPRDPALLAGTAELETRLREVDGVRLVGDRADVMSIFFLVDMHASQGERTRERIASDIAAWHDPEAAADDVDLPDPIDDRMVDDSDELDLPDDLTGHLDDRLAAGTSTIGALISSMDPDELEDLIREAIADSYRDDRPSTVSDADLAMLAALPASALDLATLDRAGVPVDDDDRDALETLAALEAAGWHTGGPDDPSGWPALVAALDARASDEVASFVDTGGLLVSVATFGGQDGAAALVADVHRLAEPLAEHADVRVASDPQVSAEIIASMSSAQLQAILISLVAAAVLLVLASWFTAHSVGLGLIGIVPSVVALVLVLGSMRLAGIAFNALTATVASISVGIGVPYGIHLINRFRESRARGLGADLAIEDTMRNTGPALVGSAVTTGLAFVVLTLSESTPIVQFGQVSFLMIGYALLACVFVQPALLVLWARRRNVVG